MKRASYRDAIEFLAYNDDPTQTDPELMTTISTGLVASIFGVPDVRVIADVLRVRKRDVLGASGS
jgi:hypothetical protein